MEASLASLMVDGRGRPDVAHWVMEISIGVDAGWVVMRARSRSCWSKCRTRPGRRLYPCKSEYGKFTETMSPTLKLVIDGIVGGVVGKKVF